MLHDAIQPALPVVGYFEDASRRATQCSKGGHKRDEKWLVGSVKWDIQEDGSIVGVLRLGHEEQCGSGQHD